MEVGDNVGRSTRRMERSDRGDEVTLYVRCLLLTCLYFLSNLHQADGINLLCAGEFEPRTGRCYLAFANFGMTYARATEHCEHLTGNLARVTDEQTIKFIQTYTEIQSWSSKNNKTSYWIGLADTNSDGIHTWWNGTTLGTYKPWDPVKNVKNLCVVVHATNRTWRMTNCTELHFFICEFAGASCDALEGYGYNAVGLGVPAVNNVSADRKTVSFECDTGYMRESGTFWWECSSSGTNLYTPTNTHLPVCAARTCDVTVTNATVTSTDTKASISLGITGKVVMVECESGYNVSNATEQTVQCNTTKGWPDAPTCIPNTCNETWIVLPSNMTLASISPPTPTSGYAIQAALSCDTGYTLTWAAGLPTRMVCDENGNWTNIPTCEPNNCTNLVVDNGVYVTTPTNAARTGVPFTVTCSAGYLLAMDPFADSLVCPINPASVVCNPKICSTDQKSITNAKQVTFPQLVPWTGNKPDVTCDDGYYLSPTSPPAVICNSVTAEWDNKPACIAYNCGPLVVVNGSVSPSIKAPTGTTVTLTCEFGYTPDTQVTPNPTFNTICGTNESWVNAPICKPNVCTNPTFLNAAMVAFPEYKNQSGQLPAVTCSEGYTLSAVTVVVANCALDGTWTNPPTCLANTCSTLTVVSGTVAPPTGVQSGMTVTVTCDTGSYLPTGPTTSILCYLNGTWIRPVTCQGYSCNATVISNVASLSFDPTPPRSGSQPAVLCQKGYSLTPTVLPTALCFINGSWTNKPQCQPNNCSLADMTTVTNAASITFPAGQVTSGMIPTIICNSGYSVNFTSVVCLANGNWDNRPICTQGGCPSLSVPDSISSPGSATFGTVGQVVCQAYYGPSTTNGTITCTAMSYWAPTIQCLRNNCSQQQQVIENSASVTFQNSIAQTDNVVTVVCAAGFDLVPSNPAVLQCQADGVWVNKPICQPKECLGDIAILNGYVTLIGGKQFNDKATITCYGSYHMAQGDGTMTCGLDGMWTPPHVCKVNNCPTLTLSNAVVRPATSITSDVSVSIDCNSGYTPNGFNNPFIVKCDRNLAWTNQPSCMFGNGSTGSTGTGGTGAGGTGGTGGTGTGGTGTVSECQLHGMQNVQTTPSQPIRGLLTTFVCHAGYQLAGQEQVMCSSMDGSWDKLPTCSGYPCGNVSIANNEAPFVTGATSGTSIPVSCKAGYTLNASLPITANCSNNGVWTNKPTCNANRCSTITIPNGNLDLTEIYTGSFPVLTCASNYNPLPVTVECGSAGNWLEEPQCLPCSTCLTLYNTNYPARLKELGESLPDFTSMTNACSKFLKYNGCLSTTQCTPIIPTDSTWENERDTMTWICQPQNLRDLKIYKPCVEMTLRSADAKKCQSELVNLNAGQNVQCSAARPYFTCLEDATRSLCSSNEQTWLNGFTQAMTTVSLTFCTDQNGAGRADITVISLVTCFLISLIRKTT